MLSQILMLCLMDNKGLHVHVMGPWKGEKLLNQDKSLLAKYIHVLSLNVPTCAPKPSHSLSNNCFFTCQRI